MRIAIRFLAPTFFLIIFAQSAFGCMCGFISPSRSIAGADIIFTGKVTKKEKAKWTFAVDKGLKGQVGSVIVLEDAWPAGTCFSSGFKKNKSYVVFVYIDKSNGKIIFRPVTCSWTAELKTVRFKDGDSSIWLEDAIIRELNNGPKIEVPYVESSIGTHKISSK